jgi:hypothetical protein
MPGSRAVSKSLQLRFILSAVCVALVLFAAPRARSQSTHQDPAGRYALSVPKGWSIANASAQALVLTAHDASVTVTFSEQSDAQAVIGAIVDQVASQWQDFEEIKDGSTSLGAQRGVFVLCSGKNPKGVASYFRVAAAPMAGGVLVMMASVPQARFAELKGGLDALERGVAKAGGKGASAGAAAGEPNKPDGRLAALEKAYADGVLTKEEFDAKRRALAPNGKEPPAAAKEAKPAKSAGADKNAKYYRMRYVKVMDSQGWGQPVEAFRMLIPSDWKSEGSVNWVPNVACPGNILQLNFRATAPDGVTGIEFWPVYNWVSADEPMTQQILQQQAQNGQGCQPGPAVGAADFLRGMVVPQLRRGAQIVSAERLETATRALQKSLEPLNQQFAAGNLPVQRVADAGRVRIAYQANGRDVEEWISANVYATISMMMSTAGAMQGDLNAKTRSYQLIGQDILVSRAPRGRLDANGELFALMFGSVQVNPQYLAAVTQFFANIARINQQAVADRQRIWRDAQAHIEKTRAETYQYQQQVQDRINEQFGQTIRGVETYVDARSNERLELSANFNQAWRHPNGDVILSNSPNFDPRVVFQEDWRELKKGP